MKTLTLLLCLLPFIVTAQDPGCETGDCDTNLPAYVYNPPVFPVGSLAIRPAKIEVYNQDDKSDIQTAMTSTLWQETTNGMTYYSTWTIPQSTVMTSYKHVKWTMATTNSDPSKTYSTYISYGVETGVYFGTNSTEVTIGGSWSGTNGEHFVTGTSLQNPWRFNHYFFTKGQ